MARIMLPNGCSCSELKIFPSDYEESTADLTKTWYIHYRFYDPLFSQKYPGGKLVIKKGINRLSRQEDRIKSIKDLKAEQLLQLTQVGYNPITKKSKPTEEPLEIAPDTPVKMALQEAWKRLKCSPGTKDDIRKALVHIQQAVKDLEYAYLPIATIKIRNCIFLLERIGFNKGGWNAPSFNHYRSYLMMLFKIIVPLADMTANPIREISKEVEIKTIREVLTDEERQRIDEFLKPRYYTFWRFLHIFFHSGARIAELMLVKREHVQLAKGRFKVLIKKGKLYQEVWKPIKNIILPLWEELLKEAKPSDYLFSKFLRPGSYPIDEWQISKRWRIHVKEKLGITADFYSLKHLNSTETVDLLDEQAAADMNSHTSTEMVETVYDTKRDQRKLNKMEKLKSVNNPFARPNS